MVCSATVIKPTFHWLPIPLRSWRSWRFFKLFQITAEARSWCQNLVHARFQYASTTLLLQSCLADYDYAALLSPFCSARGFPRRFCYDPTRTMKIGLRLVYADGDAVGPLSRPRRWSYAFVTILIPFYIKSTVELVYVQLNVNFQRYE